MDFLTLEEMQELMDEHCSENQLVGEVPSLEDTAYLEEEEGTDGEPPTKPNAKQVTKCQRK